MKCYIHISRNGYIKMMLSLSKIRIFWHLACLSWLICIVKSQIILNQSFSTTLPGLCWYYLKLTLNCYWYKISSCSFFLFGYTIISTLVCSFCIRLLQLLTIWQIDSTFLLHILHLELSTLSILVFIIFFLKACV